MVRLAFAVFMAALLTVAAASSANAQGTNQPCVQCTSDTRIACGGGVVKWGKSLPGETATATKQRVCFNRVIITCWNKSRRWAPANLNPNKRTEKACPPKMVWAKCPNTNRKVRVPEKIVDEARKGYLAAACKKRVVVVKKIYRCKRCKPRYAPPSRQGCTLRNRVVTVWLWELSKLPADLQRRIRSAREVGYRQAHAISRGLGGALRRRVGVAGLSHTPTRTHFTLRDPSGNVRMQRAVTLSGQTKIRIPFPVTGREEKADFVLRSAVVVYPHPARDMVKRLRVFGYEWGSRCSGNVHVVVQRS